MKKYVILALIAWFIGYVYGNFGNVSDFSAEFMPGGDEYEYNSRGSSSRGSSLNARGRGGAGGNHGGTSLGYRGRGDSSSYDYRSRGGDSSYHYNSRFEGGEDDSESENLEYRGRSASTGRFVHRSGRR